MTRMSPIFRHGMVMLSACFLFGFQAQAQAQAGVVIEHWQLDSGAKVYFVANPRIPMVDVRIDFDAGTRRDPPGKSGLAAATAELLQWGIKARGTDPALSPTQVSAEWADLGAQWSGYASADRTTFTLRSLSEPAVLDKAIALAARHFVDPRFESASWARLQSKSLANLRESLTRPGTVAGRRFADLVFPGHPYGTRSSRASLEGISTDDIGAFHQNFYRSCEAAVTIVGALDTAQAKELVNKLLALMPAKPVCEPLPSLPETPTLTAPVTETIAFASAQTHILVGTRGIAQSDPDVFALTLGNHILGGGGFSSRLTHEIREKRGLTYGIGSGFYPGRQVGEFQVSMQTRPEQASLAIEVLRATLQKFVQEGPSDEEVAAAKGNLVGGFALRLDSNAAIRDNVANIAWYQRPLDYLSTWPDKMAEVRRSDIVRAFQRVLDLNQLVTVVVGAPT
jgi:zinc protease